MSYPVTALFAALLTIFLIFISYRISLLRRKHKIGVGSAGNDEMQLAIRVQANFVEFVPMALLLLLLLEAGGIRHLILYALGAILLLGRILHFTGLSKFQGRSFGRYYGTILTWTMMLISALLLLVRLILNL